MVLTATGEVHTHEEAHVLVHDPNLFVTAISRGNASSLASRRYALGVGRCRILLVVGCSVSVKFRSNARHAGVGGVQEECKMGLKKSGATGVFPRLGRGRAKPAAAAARKAAPTRSQVLPILAGHGGLCVMDQHRPVSETQMEYKSGTILEIVLLTPTAMHSGGVLSCCNDVKDATRSPGQREKNLMFTRRQHHEFKSSLASSRG